MAETYFIKNKKEKNYTVIDNTFIRDCRLSWKAKGVMTYLLSLPEDWKIYLTEIEKHSKDGRDSLKTAIQELCKYGYIVKERIRGEGGKFDGIKYTVIEQPQTENPCTVSPQMVNPPLLNTNKILNTNYTKFKKHKRFIDIVDEIPEEELNNINF